MTTGRHLKSLLGIAGLLAAFAAAPGVASAEGTVKFTVTNGESINQPLAGTKPGDPENGRKVAIHRKKGNCLACHVMPVPDQPYHGNIGPDLHGVGSRYTVGELRLRVVNPKYANPATIMPAFYKADGLHRVAKGFQGKTMLSAQEVEDVVAYLATLKE